MFTLPPTFGCVKLGVIARKVTVYQTFLPRSGLALDKKYILYDITLKHFMQETELLMTKGTGGEQEFVKV